MSRPSIFTRNLKQLEESLRNYICATTITYQGIPDSFRDVSSITIQQTAEQARPGDALLALLGQKYDLSTHSLANTLKKKGISVGITDFLSKFRQILSKFWKTDTFKEIFKKVEEKKFRQTFKNILDSILGKKFKQIRRNLSKIVKFRVN